MSESAYYDLKAPIRSLVLKENMNFALIFPDDARKAMKFVLFFFRVARAHPLERVYVLPEMRPNELIEFSYLGEGGLGIGDDVFYMSEQRPYRILHFGIGIAPKNVKAWRQQPVGYTSTGWSKKAPTKAGDPIDYFDGHLSPFDEPTKASECVMWHKGSLYLAFRNDEPVSVVPKLHVLGAGYDCWLITDKAIADKMVRGAIPCRFISVGGLYEGPFTVPDEWVGKGFAYDLTTVQNLIRG